MKNGILREDEGFDLVVDGKDRTFRDIYDNARFEPRMVCTKCGTRSVDVRPNWAEYKPTKSLSDPR